tara:strand:+ start:12 stop:320 length:309 start_codon:yes stop_codon:yes gene_type:complete
MANKLRFIRKLQQGRKQRYYRHIKYPEIPLSNTDLYIITKDGDRLDLLADTFYNDTSLWWIISQANPQVLKGDGIVLKSGLQIRIPSQPELIIIQYQKINEI